MGIAVGCAIERADAAIAGLGHSPSTLWQYRWAWSRFAEFCACRGVGEVTGEIVDEFVHLARCDFEQGRIKEWKRKLLRKAALVLGEVAATGTYHWRVARRAEANDGLVPAFRLVQERFEAHLDDRRLAGATRQLYATVSRTVFAWLPTRGATDLGRLCGADVSAAAVFLAGRYRPASMRTVATALRVLCRFLEEAGARAGLAAAVPPLFARRGRPVSVLPASEVDKLVGSPDAATPKGRRDRAMLLLAARTGLRPVDIAGLCLRDIDWRSGYLTIAQHKTGALLRLPLLADVGDAIADYLLHGRPAGTADDHVFVRTQAPFTGFASGSDLWYVTDKALARARIATPDGAGRGFRVLRTSLATRMLEAGTPLPVIAGALGHRGTGSAKHYLAGDGERMRALCLDFAGIEPAARP